jgi:general secretion pathway protein K
MRERSPRPYPLGQQQRGVALLVAILLVALGTIIAAAVAYENAMTARRGTATYAFDQALLIAQGAEAFAAYGLRMMYQHDPSHTYPGQGWEQRLGPLEVVPGVMLEASLEDLQGRFNLNNLVTTEGIPDTLQVNAFVQLLAGLGLEPKWAGYLIDWIDVDIVPQNPDGAEDSVYMGQTPPYRAPNRYITSTTELLALPGFGRERYLKLAPYVAALPHGTAINVCTAPGAVLDAFLGAGHSEFGPTVTQSRSNTSGCFPSLANYGLAFDQKVWNAQGAAGAKSKFTESSSYFRLTSLITIGSAEFDLYSLLYQDRAGGAGAGSGAVRPIQRSFTPD